MFRFTLELTGMKIKKYDFGGFFLKKERKEAKRKRFLRLNL